jgi:hypothetical protein
MWRDIVAGTEGGDNSGAQDVFACAQAWREAEARGATSVMLLLAADAALRNAALDSWKEDEWDLDLMTAPGYVHGRSADEGETDTREYCSTPLPTSCSSDSLTPSVGVFLIF